MLTRILVALIFTPLFLGGLLFLPTAGTAVMISAIVAVASCELLRAAKVPRDSGGMHLCTMLSAAAIPMGWWAGQGSMVTLAAAVALMAALFFTAIHRYDQGEHEIPFEKVMICLFGGLLVPTFLSSLVRLRLMENGPFVVLLPVICAFLTDVGAYFAGVFLGRHRGITRVSPNKSLEGYIGGILSGCVFMLIYAVVLEKCFGFAVNYPVMALYGMAGSAITELGDLSFSLIKRQCGVKDYGNLLPGHGGIMDRFDSMTFAAPTLLVLVQLLQAF